MRLFELLICFAVVGSAGCLILYEGEGNGMSDIQYLHLLVADEKQERITLQHSVTEMQGKINSLSEKLAAIDGPQACSGCSSARSVAFMAQLSRTLDSPAVGHVVVFDNVQTNEGSAYNNIHGVFTAPTNGTYFFSLVASAPQEAAHDHQLHLFIMKNGREAGYVFLDDNTTHWLRRSTTAILHLTQGDEIWVQVSAIIGQHHLAGCCFHTHFGGFLVNAD